MLCGSLVTQSPAVKCSHYVNSPCFQSFNKINAGTALSNSQSITVTEYQERLIQYVNQVSFATKSEMRRSTRQSVSPRITGSRTAPQQEPDYYNLQKFLRKCSIRPNVFALVFFFSKEPSSIVSTSWRITRRKGVLSVFWVKAVDPHHASCKVSI